MGEKHSGRSILIVSQPTTGGTARHVVELSEGLAARGWRVTVACPKTGWLLSRVSSRQVRHANLPMTREIRPISDLRAFLALWRSCRRLQPDVLHLHSSKAGFLGRIAGRLARVPVVVFTPHCWSFQSATGRKRDFYVRLERFASRFCDMTVAVSQREADEAVELGVLPPERVTVIHNGVPPFRAGDLPEKIAKSIPSNDSLIVSVGRLDEQKDYSCLLDAMAAVLRAKPNSALVIAGDGPLREELLSQAGKLGISDKIVLLGEIDDVSSLLGAGHLFALSSLWEGLPYTILEAMAAGLAVIATDVGGCSELALDGETGRIVPPADPESLSRAMLQLLEDPIGRARMGAAGRRRVEEEFSLEGCTAANEALYLKLAGKKRGV